MKLKTILIFIFLNGCHFNKRNNSIIKNDNFKVLKIMLSKTFSSEIFTYPPKKNNCTKSDTKTEDIELKNNREEAAIIPLIAAAGALAATSGK